MGSPLEQREGPLPSGVQVTGDIVLFHDAAEAAGALGGGDAGVALDLAAFDGSYLSFALDLPSAILPLLTPSRLFEAGARIDCDPGASAWLRLNLRSRSAVARSVSVLDRRDQGARATIDLATFPIASHPDHAWIEVIVGCAGPASITLAEIVLWLTPRGRF